MGTTIHYAVPRYPMLMGNIRIPDDPFMGFVQQAEQLAQEVLNNIEFPHRIHRFDRQDSQDKSGPQLVYGFEIEFEEPGKGSGNLPWCKGCRITLPLGVEIRNRLSIGAATFVMGIRFGCGWWLRNSAGFPRGLV